MAGLPNCLKPATNSPAYEQCGDFNCNPLCNPACSCSPETYVPCNKDQLNECAKCCGGGDMCYSQPARQSSFKPSACYTKPTIPMDTCTIYKRSFLGIDPCEAKQARMEPIKAPNSFQPFHGRMDTNTVQKLSYVPHCGARPADLIKPPKQSIQFCGPQATITTQKHDFVPKPFCLRQPIIPQSEGILKSCAPLDSCTINRLSYQPNNCSKPPLPIRQENSIQRPYGPAATCTVQKLSYLPIELPRKEELPWARKERICPPPFQSLGTTYGLSYMPNCNPQREQPIYPTHNMKMFDGPAPNCTVYKLSYTCSNGKRESPIYPKPQIQLPSGPAANCTVYKLSYASNCGMDVTKPIKPSDNYRKSSAPIQKITTQKHDYVPKPVCKRNLIVPKSLILKSNAAMDNCTINKLSYLPVDVCNNPPPHPIKPCNLMDKITGPASNCTTYKLSYLPVCLPPKLQTPWANVSNVQKSCAPMEKCTIQKLSYMPPGNFQSEQCTCKGNPTCSEGFPTAGIAMC